MPERSVEVERKFLGVPGEEPDVSDVAEVVQRQTHELEAVYLDTLGMALTEAGWSLRHRSGGNDDGWTLKRPTGAEDARVEVHVPGPSAGGIPEALRQEARDVTGIEAVVPVTRIRTRRVESVLAVGGAHVATLASDAVWSTTAAGDDSWQEIEVELLPGGTPTLLTALANAVVRSGAEPAAHASKATRALASVPRLATPEAPDAPARDVLLTWASRQVGTLQALEPAVRADAPDAVHKTRVATRRLRSLLKTFRRLFDRRRTDAIRAELRWLGEMLGAPRDAEVLREEFGDVLAELGADVVSPADRHHLLGLLDAEHARGHAALVDALAGRRAAALHEALVDLLTDPPLRGRAERPAGEVLPAPYGASIDEVRRLLAIAEAEPDHLEHWHEVRKAAKACRYAAEALATALPGLAEEAGRWEAVTEALGVLQDTAVASELVDRVEERSGDSALWDVLRDVQADRRDVALVEGRRALAATLDAGAGAPNADPPS